MRAASIAIASLLAASSAIAGDSARPFAIVYPTVIRTQQGTSFDETSRNAIAKAIAARLGVEAVPASRRVAFVLPERGTQWELFQAGVKALPGQLGSDMQNGDYSIIVEYLVGRTRAGGEAIAGIEVYVVDRHGGAGQSGVINSHYSGFERARLVAPSADKRGLLLERATQFLLDDLCTNLSKLRAQEISRKQLAAPETIGGIVCEGVVSVKPTGEVVGCVTGETRIAAGIIPAGSHARFKNGIADYVKLARSTTLAGHRCRGFFDMETYLHPDGTLRGCALNGDQVIDGVPCLGATVARARRHKERGTTGGTWFHENGRLRQCDVARPFVIAGFEYGKGDTIQLTPDGTPVP